MLRRQKFWHSSETLVPPIVEGIPNLPFARLRARSLACQGYRTDLTQTLQVGSELQEWSGTGVMNIFYFLIQEKLLTVTLVTVTQYRAIWLQ